MNTRAARRLGMCVLLLSLSCSAACAGRVVRPGTVEDAQTAVRVKTALVNDPVVGVRPIEVTVGNGVARLSGIVASEAEAQQAAAIARATLGVREVHLELEIRAKPLLEASVPSDGPWPDGEPVLPGLDDLAEADPALLAVGASFRFNTPVSDNLESSIGVGPLLRVGSGRGLGLSIGFGWYGADLSPASGGPVAHVRIRPVMAGIGYTVGGPRVSTSFALVAGPAFNSLSAQRPSTGRIWALAVENSLAWRPGISTWIDVNRRVALNLSIGYLITRPLVNWLEEERVESRTLRGDSTMVSVGMAYKVF